MARAVKKGILGTKLGMLQVFDDEGKAIAVTVVEAGPCVVLQKKSKDSDGYEAVQIGFKAIKEKKVNKPMKGHFTRANVKPVRFIREFRVDSADAYEIGQEIKVDLFAPGDVIDVTGTSKGKGFAGGIKRHNFHRGPMGHGSKYHRRSGSLGAKGPARVFPGRKMPGRMGGDRVTTQNLTVARIYPEKNLILVKGAIPGPKRALVTITNAAKA